MCGGNGDGGGVWAEAEGRPVRRADCVGGERPCPWVGCKWHLLFAAGGAVRKIALNGDDELVDRLDRMPATCALDVADFGGATLEEVGVAIGVTRERARQIEEVALKKLNVRQRQWLVVMSEFMHAEHRMGGGAFSGVSEVDRIWPATAAAAAANVVDDFVCYDGIDFFGA